MTYRHCQPGRTILWILMGFVALFLGIALMVTNPQVAWWLRAASGVYVLAALLFFNLTITVDDREVRAVFGVGLVRKTARLEDIAAVEAVRNRWWYGWGVKYTVKGWLYSVSGLEAVEMRLKNGKRFRLGTDEPEVLCAAIRRALV